MAILDSVIATLTNCGRQIAIALTAAKEQGLSMTKFAAQGYDGWICTVCNALNCTKNDLATNPIVIMHLVKVGPLDPGYQHVWELITNYNGVAKEIIQLMKCFPLPVPDQVCTNLMFIIFSSGG